MKNFSSYLLEQDSSGRSTSLTENQFKDQLVHCSDFLNLWNKIQPQIFKGEKIATNQKLWFEQSVREYLIFRGVTKSFDQGLVDPTVGVRKSTSYLNPIAKLSKNNRIGDSIFNIIMSEHPSWKDFPPRNKSLVCTTNYSEAKFYSNTIYAIIPFNENRFGVCPDSDLWSSFSTPNGSISLGVFDAHLVDMLNLNSKGDSTTFSLADVKSAMEEYEIQLRKFYNENKDQITAYNIQSILYANNYKTFYETLGQINGNFNKGSLAKFVLEFLEIMNDTSGNSYLYEYVTRYLLSPIRNKFRLYNSSDLKTLVLDIANKYTNREIWTDGKCLLVNVKSDMMLALLNGELK